MSTKKADQITEKPPKRVRGRVAKVLQNGYKLEVAPSQNVAKTGQGQKPQSARGN
jgi:hypothetical protein